MRTIAVDPGFDRCGVAVMERKDGKDTLCFSTCLTTERGTEFSDRLLSLGTAFTEILATHQPDTLAMETLFFNKNVSTAIQVAEARGMIMYLAKQSGCTVVEYSPQAIKIAVTGYGNSDKAAVYSMLKRLVASLPTAALDDEYDAIAIGVTHLASYRP